MCKLADLYQASTLLAMISFYKSYMWLLPFCFFIAGYTGARLYMAPASLCMPSLIGMNSTQALILLSDYHVVPHVIAQKEENTVPHGTILQQTPAAGQMIKQRQSIFLVLSNVTTPPHMPNYTGMTLNDIQRSSKQENITLHIHHIPHIWPNNSCFAQWPTAGTLLTGETPIVYISAGYDQPIIWPDFIGCDAAHVIQFLNTHTITPDIICHYTHASITSYAGYKVTDQRPLAGSCVSIGKPEEVMVQLRVE